MRFVLLLTLALAALTAGLAAAEEQPRTVSVSGRGEVAAAPDMAYATVGVQTVAQTAAAALAANSRSMAAVFEELERLGVEKRDMQTTGLSLSPIYRQERSGDVVRRKTDGFQASNQLRLRIRDLARLGEILDRLVSAGSNELYGVGFDIAEKEDLLDEARVAAVRDARRKAALLAEAAGAELGEVISIVEGGGVFPPPVPFARAEMAAMPVPVAEGEQTISATVSLVYALK